MNLLQTLKATISDCETIKSITDDAVLNHLRAALCFKTCDESYEKWMEYCADVSNKDKTFLSKFDLHELMK